LLEQGETQDNNTPRPEDPSNTSSSYEIWCDYTRDPTNEHINHAQQSLIVCDHHAKQVIWSIRGTFSLSGIITDLAGYATDFCEGLAHNGMAQAAYETWHSIWDEFLQAKLQQLPVEYDLVWTGHSLGAGVACLMTIQAYYLRHHGHVPELQGRNLRCFAMAPPPVFTPLVSERSSSSSSCSEEAIANTVAYIHQFDIVPSLSVDAIRRLMNCLSRLCTVLSRHPLWTHAARRWKLGEPAQELMDAYYGIDTIPTSSTETTAAAEPGLSSSSSSSLRVIPNAPMLMIPARTLVWLEKNGGKCETKDENDAKQDWDASYLAHLLDPFRYADRILDLELPDGVVDHLTPAYETALARVEGVTLQKHKKEGC
jgi:hypothetical protein